MYSRGMLSFETPNSQLTSRLAFLLLSLVPVKFSTFFPAFQVLPPPFATLPLKVKCRVHHWCPYARDHFQCTLVNQEPCLGQSLLPGREPGELV